MYTQKWLKNDCKQGYILWIVQKSTVEWLDWTWCGLPKHLPKAPILSLPAISYLFGFFQPGYKTVRQNNEVVHRGDYTCICTLLCPFWKYRPSISVRFHGFLKLSIHLNIWQFRSLAYNCLFSACKKNINLLPWNRKHNSCSVTASNKHPDHNKVCSFEQSLNVHINWLPDPTRCFQLCVLFSEYRSFLPPRYLEGFYCKHWTHSLHSIKAWSIIYYPHTRLWESFHILGSL